MAVGLLMPPPLRAVTSETTFGAVLPTQLGGIRIVGEASPNALVTFLREGIVIGTQTADGASLFDKSFPAEEPGTYNYGVYAIDAAGRQTATLTFSATIQPAQTTIVSGLLLPPTLALGRSPIKRPQSQSTLGTARHDSTVTSFYTGSRYGDSFSRTTPTANDGSWGIDAGRTLHLGTYTVNALVQTNGGALSPLSSNLTFQVLLSADLNDDGRVSLFDFSTLMFYYGSNTDKPADINDDGRASLVDFSTMMFYWTG